MDILKKKKLFKNNKKFFLNLDNINVKSYFLLKYKNHYLIDINNNNYLYPKRFFNKKGTIFHKKRTYFNKKLYINSITNYINFYKNFLLINFLKKKKIYYIQGRFITNNKQNFLIGFNGQIFSIPRKDFTSINYLSYFKWKKFLSFFKLRSLFFKIEKFHIKKKKINLNISRLNYIKKI